MDDDREILSKNKYIENTTTKTMNGIVDCAMESWLRQK